MKRLLIIGIIGIAAAVVDLCIFTNYPQRLLAYVHASQVQITPLEGIRIWLLQQTPIGSTPAEVNAFINKHRWGTMDKMEARRFDDDYSFQADLNYYRLTSHFTLSDVRGCWDFDGSNRLAAITVFAAGSPMGVPFVARKLQEARKP